MFDTPVLGQFLSDFVRVKSNASPRPSTITYPIFEKSEQMQIYTRTQKEEYNDILVLSSVILSLIR